MCCRYIQVWPWLIVKLCTLHAFHVLEIENFKNLLQGVWLCSFKCMKCSEKEKFCEKLQNTGWTKKHIPDTEQQPFCIIWILIILKFKNPFLIHQLLFICICDGYRLTVINQWGLMAFTWIHLFSAFHEMRKKSWQPIDSTVMWYK